MENSNESNTPQAVVANNVTRIVLIGTCVLGVLGISIAIVDTAKGKTSEAKDVLQTLFATILPLFGTWIGTILAYYFSKENLAAANQTVKSLVTSLTSSTKLETLKAKDVMIQVDKLVYVEYKTGADDTTFDLSTKFLDFINTNKISRVILLDENKVAKYVLHKSTIEGFIAEQYFATQKSAAAGTTVALPPLTFADLKAKGNANVQDILKDGIKFVKEDANLSDAKTLISNYKVCNDVFITKSGLATEPVLGWITDKTITENSIV
ncbi:hypothetical protein [Mucilaginibacter sp.]|uniref:hypothetical protein n=1 Tax=Mucilaginibacter sp. TaxID=1882438 RepID=UPI0025E408FE|nr:hypothetical protein [Mucilaginibacter sp.]